VAASKLLKAVQDLQKKIEFPTNLPDAGVTREALDENIEKFKELVLQSGAIAMTPVDVTSDLIVHMLDYMVDGKPIDF